MSLTVTTHSTTRRSSNPIIEAYVQKASSAVTQLLTVAAEELERDHVCLGDNAEKRLRDLATSAGAVADLLLGSDRPTPA
jgi:hypothetical protein